ncbi:MAG: hypothetical protein WB359_23670, partial [Bryobacteraceae bacterium]
MDQDTSTAVVGLTQFFAAWALLLALWAWIPFSGQLLWGQSPSDPLESSHSQKQESRLAAGRTQS